jgi:hypothetical protein
VPGAGRVSIELLGFEPPKSERPPQGRFTGYSNISLSVDDLDAAHEACAARGLRPLQKPVDVGACGMFFLADPDGTAIELIEFPRGATTSAPGGSNGAALPTSRPWERGTPCTIARMRGLPRSVAARAPSRRAPSHDVSVSPSSSIAWVSTASWLASNATVVPPS